MLKIKSKLAALAGGVLMVGLVMTGGFNVGELNATHTPTVTAYDSEGNILTMPNRQVGTTTTSFAEWARIRLAGATGGHCNDDHYQSIKAVKSGSQTTGNVYSYRNSEGDRQTDYFWLYCQE